MKQYAWIFVFFFLSTPSWSWARELSLPPGGMITIPCHYERQYKLHKKYWCYDAASAFNYCKIQAYANNTADRVTVTDYPDQNLFTVTMRNLQTGDTGSYWCAVEIDGGLDVNKQIYITVKSDPDVSVVESSVEGQEGGGVRIQCLYSAGYQSEQKQWCRFKDRWCYKVGRTHTSQNSAVQISDDGRSRSFSVEMSGLKKSDAGWYWCNVGKLEVPVHLSVNVGKSHSDSYKIVLGCLTVLLLLILLAAVAIWFLKKRRALTQQDQVKVKKEKKSGCNRNRAAPELSYSSVLFKKVTQKSKQRSPGSQKNSASEDPVIYSTIIDT
ncbi:polymeric immunoglobulin receptor-like [Astyanax mexicanus]|nr:polymeric immunoglobulin receptor-like [Astyanax mexicanus]